MHKKLTAWMRERGLSYRDMGQLLGISHQSFGEGMKRGAWSRVVTAKLMVLTGWPHKAFLLPSERRELRRLEQKAA
jgi:hypothetical protein